MQAAYSKTHFQSKEKRLFSRRQPVQHASKIESVQNTLFIQPTLPGGVDSGGDMLQSFGFVGVGIDATHEPLLCRFAPVTPIHVEPPGARVKFDNHAIGDGCIDHFGRVDLVGFATQ